MVDGEAGGVISLNMASQCLEAWVFTGSDCVPWPPDILTVPEYERLKKFRALLEEVIIAAREGP